MEKPRSKSNVDDDVVSSSLRYSKEGASKYQDNKVWLKKKYMPCSSNGSNKIVVENMNDKIIDLSTSSSSSSPHRDRESSTVLDEGEKNQIDALFAAIPLREESSSSSDVLDSFSSANDLVSHRRDRKKRKLSSTNSTPSLCSLSNVATKTVSAATQRRLPTTASYIARHREEQRQKMISNRKSRKPVPLKELSSSELYMRLKEHGFVELAEHLLKDNVSGKMLEFFDSDILENKFDLKRSMKRRDLMAWINTGIIL